MRSFPRYGIIRFPDTVPAERLPVDHNVPVVRDLFPTPAAYGFSNRKTRQVFFWDREPDMLDFQDLLFGSF